MIRSIEGGNVKKANYVTTYDENYLTNAIIGRFHADATIASFRQNSSGPIKAETPWSRFSVIILNECSWLLDNGSNLKARVVFGKILLSLLMLLTASETAPSTCGKFVCVKYAKTTLAGGWNSTWHFTKIENNS